ncbi:MAG: sigma-70 family RNA polymerase sigma factor [Oscillospiraceae bacterium]|nr:sigma-70 family RNA polymerase sigma factor [Oscillospiraceae bacterium]
MRNTPYSIRNNEVYGDMAAWLRANAEDNESDVRRLKRNLRLAREEELTPRQRQLMQMRFEQNMSVTEIAQALGLDKSTVSRTITRAKQRLYKCLRYCL